MSSIRKGQEVRLTARGLRLMSPNKGVPGSVRHEADWAARIGTVLRTTADGRVVVIWSGSRSPYYLPYPPDCLTEKET